MHVEQAGIDGLILIEPRCFRDDRGFFLETFQRPRYEAAGITDDFVQENHSHSVKNVLRGLHFQVKRPQAQLVTVMRGRIFDVTVDLRRGSSTFGRWFGVNLDADQGPRQLYMAAGFAHGFCVLSDVADLHYKVTRIYDPSDEGGLLWNDPDLAIRWPLPDPVLSARDSAYPPLRALDQSRLPHIEPRHAPA